MFKASNGETNFRQPSEIVPYENREIIPCKTLVAKFTRIDNNWCLATLDSKIERVSRFWLMAYHIKNPSSLNPVRVAFFDANSSRGGLTTGLINVNMTTSGQTNSIYLPNYQPGERLLVADWKFADGVIENLAIKIYDATDDTQITWDTAIFWFEYEALNWNN